MAALPGQEWVGEAATAAGPALASVRHVFTHFELLLSVVEGATPIGEGWWQPIGSISGAGLPTLYRRAVDAVLKANAEQRRAA
jgi:A/G-specific adenine glycosylase